MTTTEIPTTREPQAHDVVASRGRGSHGLGLGTMFVRMARELPQGLATILGAFIKTLFDRMLMWAASICSIGRITATLGATSLNTPNPAKRWVEAEAGGSGPGRIDTRNNNRSTPSLLIFSLFGLRKNAGTERMPHCTWGAGLTTAWGLVWRYPTQENKQSI